MVVTPNSPVDRKHDVSSINRDMHMLSDESKRVAVKARKLFQEKYRATLEKIGRVN